MRVDTGVEEGGEVSPFYDPMIAKLIAHGDRPARRAAGAWPRPAHGARSGRCKTNAGFLAACAATPDSSAGDIDTGFIDGPRATP